MTIARLVRQVGQYALTKDDQDGRIYVLAPSGKELESFTLLEDAIHYAKTLIRDGDR